MNLSDDHLDPQRLVEDYFLRDLTGQELATLNAALSVNSDLKAQFMKSMYDDLDLFEAIENIEKEQQLRDRTVFRAKKKSARMVRLNRINRLAASLVVLLGIGAGGYLFMNPSPEIVEHPAEEIIQTPTEGPRIEMATASDVHSEEPRIEIETVKEVQPEKLAVRDVMEEWSPPDVPEIQKEIRMVARITDLFVLDEYPVSASNAEGIRELHAGDLLGIGDALSIPAGGRLSIEYLSDPITVSFEENSSFTLRESKGEKQLDLHQGRVVAHVTKQLPGELFRILTDDAEFAMHESRMELADRGDSVLSVLSGKVQMKDVSDNDSVVIPAGYYAESHRGRFSRPVEFENKLIYPSESTTMPEVPRQHQEAKDTYIIVDPNRNLTGRIDFRVPIFRGKITAASLRLRVVPFKTDRGGRGTLRVNKVDRRHYANIGEYTGRVKAGLDLIFNIDPVHLTVGKNELLLEMDEGGDDFWFGSADSQHPPELRLTITKD